MINAPSQRPLTIVQAAATLGWAPRTIRRAVLRGLFPGAVQLARRGQWRIPRAAVEAIRSRAPRGEVG